MTPPIVQRLRDAAAAIRDEPVSMQAMAQAHGPEAHGTVLLLLAMPCLLPVPGVGAVLRLGMSTLAVAMWKGQCTPCFHNGWPSLNCRATGPSGCCSAWLLPTPWPGDMPGPG